MKRLMITVPSVLRMKEYQVYFEWRHDSLSVVSDPAEVMGEYGLIDYLLHSKVTEYKEAGVKKSKEEGYISGLWGTERKFGPYKVTDVTGAEL